MPSSQFKSKCKNKTKQTGEHARSLFRALPNISLILAKCPSLRLLASSLIFGVRLESIRHPARGVEKAKRNKVVTCQVIEMQN